MPEPLSYRKQVLHAVDAFLRGTPASISQGQHLVDECLKALRADLHRFALDGLIWRSLLHPLTDSIFFTSQEYLQELRNVLLGLPAQARNRIFIKQDFRPYLTPTEAQWYAQLLSMLDFLDSLPFAQIAEATAEARHNLSGSLILAPIPEAIPIQQAHDDYQQRKTGGPGCQHSIPEAGWRGDHLSVRLTGSERIGHSRRHPFVRSLQRLSESTPTLCG
jgi:hypothetical protein